MDGLLQPSDHSRDASYGDMIHASKNLVDGVEGAAASNPVQDQQNVASAIIELIATPAGERQFRTVVDKMGLGGAVVPYNQAAEDPCPCASRRVILQFRAMSRRTQRHNCIRLRPRWFPDVPQEISSRLSCTNQCSMARRLQLAGGT